MSTEKTHWKVLTNPDYIGCYSLPTDGSDFPVTIESVSKSPVKGEGGKVEQLTVAKLVGQKPMILNKTNCKTIAALFGTPYIEDWAGKTILLYADRHVKLGKDIVEGLRIRSVLPTTLKEREKLTPEHPRWKGALESLQKGNTTIAQIKGVFDISPEHQTLLTAKPKADEGV